MNLECLGIFWKKILIKFGIMYCTGKSTAEEVLKESVGAEVYIGKDYLKMAGNESIAGKKFTSIYFEKNI